MGTAGGLICQSMDVVEIEALGRVNPVNPAFRGEKTDEQVVNKYIYMVNKGNHPQMALRFRLVK